MSTFAIAPSVFNEWMLRNDEDYQQLNTRDKDNNYYIPLGVLTEKLGVKSDDDKGKFRKKVIDIGWQVDGRWHIDGCSGVDGMAWMSLPQPYTEGSGEE